MTQTKDKENEILKDKIQTLQAELAALRGQKFDFDFNVLNPSPNASNNLPRNPFQQSPQANTKSQSSRSPSTGSISDGPFFRSGQSSLATSPENGANKNATPNIDIPFDLFSNNSAGPVNFTNTSNGSSIFSTDLFGATTATSLPRFNQNQNQNTAQILDTFTSTLTSLTNAQSQSPLSSGFSTNIPSSASTAPLNTFQSSGTSSIFDLNDPLFSIWRDNSASSTADDSNSFDIFDTMFSSMSPGAFNLVDQSGLTDFIVDSPLPIQQASPTNPSDKGITCPELWEKVRNHPNFEEIDIDQLCAELRLKAKVRPVSKSIRASSYCKMS